MEITPISVTELNTYVQGRIDNDAFLDSVYVRGEISNCKLHYTGHIYFTLKDENSLIKCIMFKSYTPHLTFTPKDGMKVCVLGSVKVFIRDGVYQIYAKGMKQDGIGELYEAYEKLKAKLEKEGLFDEAHKKAIPQFPKTIGVLTASTGSVIRDIINVSTRRNPNVHIRLLPVPVQGSGAEIKIAQAINQMNEQKLADCIILGRGGGSLEDLWPFNEEIVARAIYNSDIPIISAVGHETDFSISDFVADLRAPTPSAAAELAVPNMQDVIYTIDTYKDRLKTSLKRKLQLNKMRLEKIMNSRAYKDPLRRVNEYRIIIDNDISLMQKDIRNKYETNKQLYLKLLTKLDALSPLKTMQRGYNITQKDGKVIKSAKELEIGDEVTISFYDGKRKADIKE